ncbi:hypothetical protein SAMN02745163_00984 [Clostridium cavendishii DSM 21758]|uniref:Uncharacterized protein n=1 Tax=Clostridium cavendishii DSM 21758 TaxID=1121302 RepID=A0A1M6EYM4_9CLOT|nr:hypothetical protein [Clostridium cavendishii]SHI90489.1 hypothetical protein SAMN02745163_00984 [Clostridium cavendishii DSM 21758]
MLNNYIESEINSTTKNNFYNNSFLRRFFEKFTSTISKEDKERLVDPCKNLNKKRYAYTTGILSRVANTNAIRITLLNLNNGIEHLEIGVYDWTKNVSECFYYNKISLNQYKGKVIDIILKDNSYDDILNVELFEVRLYPYTEAVKVNIFSVNLENN